MGIEYRYDYIYYTVLDLRTIYDFLRSTNHDDYMTLSESEILKIASIAIDNQLKNNEDDTLNNYKVDYSWHSMDIGYWISRHIRHKEVPIFIQIQDTQPIQLTGSGCLFVLYNIEEETNDTIPDTSYGDLDALAGLGGRL